MNEQHSSLPNTTQNLPKPRSYMHMIAKIVALSCVAVAVWWGLEQNKNINAQRLNSNATSTVPTNGVPVQAAGALPHLATTPAAAEPPPANLHEALQRAQVAASKKPAPPPTAQSLEQPDRSAPNEEKLKAFGKMFNTALASQQPDSSAVSPFGQIKN